MIIYWEKRFESLIKNILFLDLQYIDKVIMDLFFYSYVPCVCFHLCHAIGTIVLLIFIVKRDIRGFDFI